MELADRVVKEVRNGFLQISEGNSIEEAQFLHEMKQFIKERKILCIFKDLHRSFKQGLKFYNTPWKLSNSLSQCRIYCKNWDEDIPFHFPLELMHNPDMLMYYDLTNAPNLVLFISEESPAAIFTKTGFLSLAGGLTMNMICHCMSICCCKILFVLSQFYPDLQFGIRGFSMFNTVATTTLLLHKICIPRLIDDVRSFGFMAQQNSDEINFLYLKQFVPFRPSITFCVPATGGINIIGFTNKFEVRWASLILSWFLRKHCVLTEPINMKSLKKARAEKVITDQKRATSKRNKKIKKLVKWATPGV